LGGVVAFLQKGGTVVKGDSEVPNPSTDAQGTNSRAATGPVMLALSTFRQSDKAVALALEKAQAGKKLVIVHVADVNLARYLIGTDIGLYPELKEKCEQELLREHEQKGKEKVESIVRRARAAGLDVATYVRIGRFAPICLEIMEVSPTSRKKGQGRTVNSSTAWCLLRQRFLC